MKRPDGRHYRPRTPGLHVRAWENPDGDGGGCIVFGTLDPEGLTRDRARDACNAWYGDADSYDVANPIPGWWRDGFTTHGRTWIQDDKRGAPGVMFTWAAIPEHRRINYTAAEHRTNGEHRIRVRASLT